MSKATDTALRSYYFFFYMATASAGPFLAPYLKEACGFSDRLLGIFFTVPPAIALVSQPLWSFVADRTGQRSRVASALIVASAATFLLVMLPGPHWMTVAFMGCYSFFYSPLGALGDSVALAHLGEHRRLSYGRLRLFGTIGFLVAVPGIGWVLDKSGMRWLFPMSSAAMLASALFLARISAGGRSNRHDYLKALTLLCRNPNVVVFLISGFVLGMSSRMAMTFLSVYARTLGATNAHVGWMWLVATLAEAGTMVVVGGIVRRLGLRRVLIIGALGTAVRWSAMAWVTDWRLILPLQALHALSFCFVYVGNVTFMAAVAGPAIRSSAQAVQAMLVMNAGGIAASLISGEVAQRWGYHTLFAGCGATALAAVILMTAFLRDPASAADNLIPPKKA